MFTKDKCILVIAKAFLLNSASFYQENYSKKKRERENYSEIKVNMGIKFALTQWTLILKLPFTF